MKRVPAAELYVLMPDRKFLPPWSVEEKSAYFIVRDNNGQALAYVYFENESRRRSAPELLTKDEARRIATQMAKLPELLHKDWINRVNATH